MELDTLSILSGIMIVSILSSLYKYNQVFSLVERFTIGTVMGQSLVASLQSIYTVQLLPLSQMKNIWVLSGAVIIGILYFTVLSKRLLPAYRFVMIIALAMSLSTTLQGGAANIIAYVTKISNLSQPTNIILIILFFIATFYFVYGAAYDKPGPAMWLRESGRYTIFMVFGILFVGCFFRASLNMTGWFVLDLLGRQGMIIVGIAGLVILVDALGLLKRKA